MKIQWKGLQLRIQGKFSWSMNFSHIFRIFLDVICYAKLVNFNTMKLFDMKFVDFSVL